MCHNVQWSWIFRAFCHRLSDPASPPFHNDAQLITPFRCSRFSIIVGNSVREWQTSERSIKVPTLLPLTANRHYCCMTFRFNDSVTTKKLRANESTPKLVISKIRASASSVSWNCFYAMQKRSSIYMTCRSWNTHGSPCDADQSGDDTLHSFLVVLEEFGEGPEVRAISDTRNGVEPPSRKNVLASLHYSQRNEALSSVFEAMKRMMWFSEISETNPASLTVTAKFPIATFLCCLVQ